MLKFMKYRAKYLLIDLFNQSSIHANFIINKYFPTQISTKPSHPVQIQKKTISKHTENPFSQIPNKNKHNMFRKFFR